jgi:hypothetical protein
LTSDYEWWGNGQLENPPKEIGDAIALEVFANHPDQDLGFMWVDFTLRYDELSFFDDPPAFPYGIEIDNLWVDENTAGAFIGNVAVFNADSQAVHDFDFSDDRFEIVDHELRLKSTESLDFELEPEVGLEIGASHNDRRYADQFTISVNDLEDK